MSERLNIKSLADVIAKKHQLDSASAEAFVRTMFDVVKEGLNGDKLVKVKGLGTFKLTSISARKSVDVNTGEDIVIEGRDKISFIPDNVMRDWVNKPFSHFETVVINDGVEFEDTSTDENADEEDRDDEEKIDKELEIDSPKDEVDESKKDNATVEQNGLGTSAVSHAIENIAQTLENLSVDVDKTAEKAVEESEKPETGENVADTSSNEIEVADKPNGVAFAVSQKQDSAVSEEHQEPNGVGDVEEKSHRDVVDQSLVEEEKVDVLFDEISSTDESLVLSTEKEEEQTTNEDLAEQQENLNQVVTSAENQSVIDFGSPVSEPKIDIWKYIGALSLIVVLLMVGVLVWYRQQLVQKDKQIVALEQLVDEQEKQLQTIKPQQMANADSTIVLENEKETTPVNDEKTASTGVSAHDKAEVGAATADKKATEARKETEEKDLSSVYDKDPRIRTGAYRIVGIDKIVTVRPGQTMASISRTHLGEGMECYVEAVNGGKTLVKEGEKIKIPKLEHKKKRK